MTPSSSTPLWLDLRTEYIDDNFEKVVEYLRNADKNDSFYKKTKELFEQRIEQLLEEMSNRSLYADPANKDTTLKAARMLAVYLLTHSHSAKFSAEAFVALAKTLASLWPDHAKTLINKSIERLQHNEVDSLGFTWSDYDKIAQELFIYNLVNNSKFSAPIKGFKYLSQHGSLLLDKNGLHLCSSPIKEAEKLLDSGAKSMDTSLKMTVVTPAGDKLKKSQEKDIKAIEKFVKDLKLDFQNKTYKNEKQKISYTNDDEATIRVTKKINNTLYVRTIDKDHEIIEGKIVFQRNNINFYYDKDLCNFIEQNDILRAKILDIDKKTFSIEKHFIHFFVEECKKEIGYASLLAKCINPIGKHLGWISQDGYPLLTEHSDNYKKGDLAVLQIKKYYSPLEGQYGRIDAEIVGGPEKNDEDYYTKGCQKDCFRAFVDTCTDIYNKVPIHDNSIDKLSTTSINLIIRLLFEYQKSQNKPSERYLNLSLAMLMATIVGDNDSVSYIEFAKNYLQSLIAFVNDEPVDELFTSPGDAFASATSTKLRVNIVELLKEYGKDENSTLLNNAIESENPTISKIAKLIQSNNMMKKVLEPGVLSVIKHEILKSLSIENEKDTDFEADSKPYIGMESSTIEFKMSAIFDSNKTDIPDETKQNSVIANTVCAFLNSQAGGTLYIGVNNQGYVEGIDNDMKYKRYNDIDTYSRYIQDMLKQRLGKDASSYWIIEPAYNNKVLVVNVQPHPYQVVEHNNKAYARRNSESIIMTEDMRLELISEKQKRNKEKAYNISWLRRANQLHKCVILHGYASSNGKRINDRRIEPYKVLEQDDLVLGYDCDIALDKKPCRVFNINRINYVEMLENEDWTNTAHHEDIIIDSFHLSGERAMPVSLELDLMARNLLIEEFPRTKEKITADKKDSNKYYYNDTVRSILGITRFYMGLADHITIIEAPQEFHDKIKEIAQGIMER